MLEKSHFSNDEYKWIETPKMDFLDHKKFTSNPIGFKHIPQREKIYIMVQGTNVVHI